MSGFKTNNQQINILLIALVIGLIVSLILVITNNDNNDHPITCKKEHIPADIDETKHLVECDYDDNGNLIEQRHTNNRGGLFFTFKYTYDDGRLIVGRVFDANGNLIEVDEHTDDNTIKRIKYDTNGNVIESSEFDKPKK